MEKHNNMLDQIPADYTLIEELYSHGKITWEAREYALNFLYPRNQWGVLASRFMLVIGGALLLSGIFYFLAFNWEKITVMMQLYSIQLSIVACVTGAYFYSLERTSGQIFLFCGSMLVGVFMLVFGQIYQAGADAYQLFMMWSLFIFGWTLISNFAAQWMLWLSITNFFIILWWENAVLPTKEMECFVFTYLAVLNGLALAMREYFLIEKEYKWLEARWVRIVLVIAVLLALFIPAALLIIDASKATKSIVIGGVIGLIGNVAMYYFYRYKLPDINALAAVVFSGCIISEILIFKIFMGELFRNTSAATYFMIGFMTLVVFAIAIIYLRNVSQKLEAGNV